MAEGSEAAASALVVQCPIAHGSGTVEAVRLTAECIKMCHTLAALMEDTGDCEEDAGGQYLLTTPLP